MRTAVVRVAEAKPRDVGQGIVRIDPSVAEKLNITTGDIVEIVGRNRTVAISWYGYPEDRGNQSIRIDGATRRNAGVGLDDKASIRRIEARPASKLVLAPTENISLTEGEEYFKKILEGRAVTQGDFLEISVISQKILLVVVSYKPKCDAVIINSGTEIKINPKPVKEVKHSGVRKVSYEDIGGLHEEVRRVREMIELPLRHPEIFDRLGISAPKGVLLHGPPGTGKTLLAKAVANETEAYFVAISGPEIMSKFYGESEGRLREIFRDAERNAPSIIFIDELDSIAPKREEVTGEVERRVVAQLLALMDGLQSRGEVVVIGATNRPNALDPALRRGGRFDREIEFGIPNKQARLEILQIHTRGMPLAENVDLKFLAEYTHGFVGADIEALCKEAAMLALRRVLPEIDLETESIPAEVLNRIEVDMQDFTNALRNIEPSAMREVLVEVPNVRWEDVGGLREAKQQLIETVEWPLKYCKFFNYMGAKPIKGIFLHGPPGTGKTLLVKALANESQANFISIKGPEFLSKYVGESERAVREIFRKARQSAPCIIFFDEIDAIAPIRGLGFGDSHVSERVISQILTEMDGLEELHNVVVVAATNRPDIVDRALLCPGRFDRIIYIPIPDKESRMEIFKIHTAHSPLDGDVDLKELAERTEGYTGADIYAICNEAVMVAIREYIMGKQIDERTEEFQAYTIKRKHFEKALEKVKPLPREQLERYEEIARNFVESLT
ncbi:MAG: CDC48 family AAA ATPase [Candidatus Jordarchaeaceae archaeon]